MYDDINSEIAEFCTQSRKLYFPNWSIPIEIETDASRHAIAGWAYQTVNEETRPIAYISRSLLEAEKKYYDLLGIHESTGYETRQIETLAILYVLEELNHLLEGAEKVTVRTDHRNILWLKNYKKPTGRLLRWAIKLSQVMEGVNLEFIKGEANTTADAMSRLHASVLDIREHPSDDSIKRFTLSVESFAPSNTPPDSRFVEPRNHRDPTNRPYCDISALASLWTLPDLPDDICAMRELLSPDPLEKAPIPTELNSPPSRQEILMAQRGDEEISRIRIKLFEINRLWEQHSTPAGTSQFTTGIKSLLNRPVETAIRTIKAFTTNLDGTKLTQSYKRKLVKIASRYRLDQQGELVIVRPNHESKASRITGPRGDIAHVSESGPLSDDAILIPISTNTLTLRTRIIRFHHEALMGGAHLGAHHTLDTCKRHYYWVNMAEDVRDFCAACIGCKLAKTSGTKRHGLLHSFDRSLPFETIALDILTFKSRASRGPRSEQHILIMYDVFTRYLIAKPLVSRQAKHVCDMIVRHLLVPYGAPRRFITDNEFSSMLFKDLVARLHAHTKYTSPYHSQGNPAERPLRTIQTLLRAFVNADEYLADANSNTWLPNPNLENRNIVTKMGSWPHYLPCVVAALNSMKIPGTDVTPFLLLHGFDYRMMHQPELGPPPSSVADRNVVKFWEEKQQLLKELYDEVRKAHAEIAAKNRINYSMTHRWQAFEPGDTVLVQFPTRAGKLANQFIGPCRVMKKLSDILYLVRDIKTNRDIPKPVHVQRLARYHAHPKFGSPVNLPLPEPDEADKTPDFSETHPPAHSDGPIYWPVDETDDKMKKFIPGTFIVYQSPRSPTLLVAKILDHKDEGDVEVHRYTHDKGDDPRIKFNPDLRLSKRKLAPEYRGTNRNGLVTPVGTLKPKPGWEPGTVIFSYYEVHHYLRVFARDFKLSPKGFVPQNIIDTLHHKHGSELHDHL